MADKQIVRENYHTNVRSDVLGLVPNGLKSVLDIGGGVGHSAAFLKRETTIEKAVVVDLVADYSLPEIDGSYAGDLNDSSVLEKIKQEHGKFDVNLCLDVLEHLVDPWALIQRCHEMLNPGGVIVTSIPNVRNWRVVLPLVFQGRFDREDQGILDRTHLRWFVKQSAIDLMTSSGLSVEHVEGRFLGWKNRLIQILSFGLLSNFLHVQYYIRVRLPK